MGLVVTRRMGEGVKIELGGEIVEVVVNKIRGKQIRLLVLAPITSKISRTDKTPFIVKETV